MDQIELRMTARALIGLMLAATLTFAGEAKPKLLGTQRAAAKIKKINDKLMSEEFLDDGPDASWRERDFSRLKQIETSFVIAQLEAEPNLTESQLRSQLFKVLAGTRYPQSDVGPGSPPYVFKALTGNKADPVVWAICYPANALNGMGGARTIVESYVVSTGKARLAGSLGREMDGYDLRAERIYNPGKNSVSILTHGIYEWSSGAVLPTAATLYGVSETGVKKLWGMQARGIEFVGSTISLFCIQYDDSERRYKNLPSTTVDVYALDQEFPYRVIHQVPVFRQDSPAH